MSLGDLRPLWYSSRNSHAEGEHVNRGRDTPSPACQVGNLEPRKLTTYYFNRLLLLKRLIFKLYPT
jgi:hypothetical protein